MTFSGLFKKVRKIGRPFETLENIFSKACEFQKAFKQSINTFACNFRGMLSMRCIFKHCSSLHLSSNIALSSKSLKFSRLCLQCPLQRREALLWKIWRKICFRTFSNMSNRVSINQLSDTKSTMTFSDFEKHCVKGCIIHILYSLILEFSLNSSKHNFRKIHLKACRALSHRYKSRLKLSFDSFVSNHEIHVQFQVNLEKEKKV